MIRLKLVLTAAGREAAEREIETINAGLGRMGTVSNLILRPHFDDPDEWELVLFIDPPEAGFAAFERLIGLASCGWRHGESDPDEDRWAVWNRTGEAVLLTPSVFWGHLETCSLPAESEPAD